MLIIVYGHAAAADDVAVDVPADALGRLDSAGVAVGGVLRRRDGGDGVGDGCVHGLASLSG